MTDIIENSTIRVLLVDDETRWQKKIGDFLERYKFKNIYIADSGADGLVKLKEKYIDVILLDINMHKKDGIEVLKEIRANGYETPIIMLTIMDKWKEAFESGANMYVKKENMESELIPKIRFQVEHYLRTYGFFNQRYFLNHIETNNIEYCAVMEMTNMDMIINTFGWNFMLKIFYKIKELGKGNIYYDDKNRHFVYIYNRNDETSSNNHCIDTIEKKSQELEKIFSSIEVDMIDINLHWKIKLYKRRSSVLIRAYKLYSEKLKTKNSILVKNITQAFNNKYGWNIMPFFQSIRDYNGEIVKFEVLARVVNPGSGKTDSIFPYLKVIQAAGIEHKLTEIILEKSINQFRKSKYLKDNNCGLTFNITESDLIQGKSLFELLEKARKGTSKSYEISRKRITLEILERDGLGKDALAELQKLEKDGYKIAIDDFGAERSSFDKITRIGRDVILKIDGQFIRDIKSNKRHQKIVRSIAKVADELGFLTIAEHVEDKTVLEILHGYGIDLFQGFYDGGRPQPFPSLPQKPRRRYAPRKRSWRR